MCRFYLLLLITANEAREVYSLAFAMDIFLFCFNVSEKLVGR
jgi:hypothetical protein